MYNTIYMYIFFFDFPEPVRRFTTRRKSVFAEAYDPENDADDDEAERKVYPKSDEQRARLTESVKNVLLFRSLDDEQVGDVECTNKKHIFCARNMCALNSGLFY